MSNRERDLARRAMDTPYLLEPSEVQELGSSLMKSYVSWGRRLYFWVRGIFLLVLASSAGLGAVAGIIFGISYATVSCGEYEQKNAQGYYECLKKEDVDRCTCQKLWLWDSDQDKECK